MLKVTLGRDGMGGSSEADFDAWVAYVCAGIDGATGLSVDVDARVTRDVQTDDISADNEEDEQTVREALRTLWDEWCANGASRVVAESATQITINVGDWVVSGRNSDDIDVGQIISLDEGIGGQVAWAGALVTTWCPVAGQNDVDVFATREAADAEAERRLETAVARVQS